MAGGLLPRAGHYSPQLRLSAGMLALLVLVVILAAALALAGLGWI